MEAGRKRKAPNATPSSSDGSASKKLKLLNSNHASQTKSKVQEVGLRLIEQLHRSTDKTGRSIATEFLTLPARDELPDYYEFTKLPIAIDTIEKKLQRNAYPTVTMLESDFKRMIQNAKDYNAPKSDIYEDAERIRKLVYNYMKIHNPEYEQNPDYSSFPTPIPQVDGTAATNGTHDHDEEMEDAPGEPEPSERQNMRSTAPKSSEPPSDRKTSMAPSAVTGDGEGDDDDDAVITGDLDFDGMSFQDAQQKIISYMLHYQDDEGLEIYSPFGNLPTRKLEDYYKLIRHPVSLKSVAKRTKGIHGRAPPTGVTDFKNWDQFEEEVSYIWRNAYEYNEDSSDMYNLAGEFEQHFKSLVADARSKIEEPSGPRIKLGGPKPKVTLNLSQRRNSPTPGVSVDNAALLRQKQMVAAGVNGRQTSQQPQRPSLAANGVTKSSSQVPTIEAKPQSAAQSGSPLDAPVKAEKLPSQSPALNTVAPAAPPLTNGMMPPPAVRPPSGSPFPSQAPVSSYTFTAPSLLPPAALRSYPIEAALLPSVTVASHPQLKVSKPFSMAIPPHATLSQQSTTITLPSPHYFLQISPTISKQLSMGRPYKMFVTLNGTRLNQRDTQFHADTGKRTHVYEGSLAQGVNRVEVEVVAAKQEGDGKGLDVEKVTVYANLMR